MADIDTKTKSEKPIATPQNTVAILTQQDVKVLADTLQNMNVTIQQLNKRIEQLEHSPPTSSGSSGWGGENEAPQQQPKQQVDLGTLLQLMNASGGESGGMKDFYASLGERYFFKIADKLLPSKKELNK